MSIWTDLLLLHGHLVRLPEDLPAAPASTPTPPAVERHKLRIFRLGRPAPHRTPGGDSSESPGFWSWGKPQPSVEQEARLLRELWAYCH